MELSPLGKFEKSQSFKREVICSGIFFVHEARLRETEQARNSFKLTPRLLIFPEHYVSQWYYNREIQLITFIEETILHLKINLLEQQIQN